MTISAIPSSNTVPVIRYGITLKGIKSTCTSMEVGELIQKINIIRSLVMSKFTVCPLSVITFNYLGPTVLQQHSIEGNVDVMMSSVEEDNSSQG